MSVTCTIFRLLPVVAVGVDDVVVIVAVVVLIASEKDGLRLALQTDFGQDWLEAAIIADL